MPNSLTSCPPWAPYARTVIRRLRQAEADNSFNIDLGTEGDAIAPPSGGTTSAIDLLDELEHSQRQHPCDLEEMREAGIDGLARDDTGADWPARFIEPGKILMALRLAVTFGSEERFRAMLHRRAITLVEGFEPEQISGAATTIGRLFLPDGWTAQTRAPRGRDGGILQLLRPFDSGSRKLSDHACRKVEGEILSALAMAHPVMILLPRQAAVSADLRRVLPPAIPLAPIDRNIVLSLLAQTHSATEKIDRSLVAPLLPDNAALAEVDTPSLFAALRAPDACAAARALTGFLAPPADTESELTLEDIGGDSPAHQAAAALVSDLSAWKRGEARWSGLSHSLLLSGEPGTGKSLLARAIALSAGVPLVGGSFGTWQSHGHLGDMLREMRQSFAEAIARKPSVLFIDEVDAAGSRDSSERHNLSYRRQVINQFLSEIDQLQRAEGVILLGATNHPEALDPAILRAGRFDLHASLGRPTQTQIRHMLGRALPEAGDAEISILARVYSGETPATIDAALRAAKSRARRERRPFTPQMLLAARPTENAEFDRRIALHECGHAVAAALLGAGPVRRMQLMSDGGGTTRASAIRQGTVHEFGNELTILMAGRAAERALLGTISAGAGGSENSDLALASKLQLQFDREFGLGTNGNAWVGPSDMKRLSDGETDRLRVKLDHFERRARRLLEPHLALLERLADHLVQQRELGEEELKAWLPSRTTVPQCGARGQSPEVGED